MRTNESVDAREVAWRPLFILSEPGLSAELQAAWPKTSDSRTEPIKILESYPDPEAAASLIASSGVNICVLDTSVQKRSAFEILRQLKSTPGTPPVLTVHGASDGESVLLALRQGAAGFLTRPVSSEQVLSVLSKLKPAPPLTGPSAKVICVMPASGSSGASTLACAIAQIWRKRGSKKVLLADLDRFTGCLSFLLRLRPSWSFVDALSRGNELDLDVWNGLVYSVNNMDVLLAPEKPDPALEDLTDAAPLLRFARAHYDVIVADCDRGTDPWALSIVRQADSTLLVATPDSASVEAAKLLARNFEQQGVPPSSLMLVLNQESKARAFRGEDELGIPLVQVVPNDYSAVHRALMDGAPVSAGSGIGKALSELIPKLAGGSAEGSRKDKPSGLGHLISFFSRR